MTYYHHGYSVHKDQRRRSRLIKGSFGFALIVLIGLAVVIWDSSRTQQTTKVLSSQDISFESQVSLAQTKKITTKEFSIEVPENWIKIKPEQIVNAPKYSFSSDSKESGLDSKRLDIFIDAVQADYTSTRMLPIGLANNKISVGTISTQCFNFAKDDDSNDSEEELDVVGAPVKAVWMDVTFKCNLSNLINRVATGTSKGMMLKIPGNKAKHSYMFSYTDHADSPDDLVFIKILESFKPL